VGPVSDRWGTWVSALVPLTDPQGGHVLAVLGMDIDARVWKWDLAARASLPMGITLVLVISLLTALAGAGRASASPKPVLRRLLPSLAALLLLLFAGAGAILWQQHRSQLAEKTAMLGDEIAQDLKTALEQQAQGLATTAQLIAADARVSQALRDGDADRLLADWRGLFETIQQQNALTHFGFLDANRVYLQRIHQPEERGDKVDRFTAIEAERTGKTASGIELGPLGTFTLRVVQPVLDGKRRVGYVELGKEIEDVLQNIHSPSGRQVALVLRKEAISRETWEAGMRLLGREADWNRLPRSVVIYASHDRLPDAVALLADHDPAGGHTQGVNRDIVTDGKTWRAMALPLQDASGNEVGDLLVMSDITADKAAFARITALGGAASVVLLAMLLGLVFALLHRTDLGIRAQQAELRESEEYLLATLRSIGDGVIVCDREGRVASLNGVAESMTGWTTAEAAGRPVEEVFHIVHAQTREAVVNPVEGALREGVSVDLANHTELIARDGTKRQIADSCAPIKDTSGVVIGVVLVFRDVTGEYRRREELRQERQRMEFILQATRINIDIVDSECNLRQVDADWQKIYGDPRGRKCHEYFMGLDKPCPGCGIPQALATREVVISEEFLPKENRPIEVHTIPFQDENGEWLVAELNIDITARKQAEETLRESEARLRIITESAQDAILMMDPNGLISFWNPAAERILGYTREEALGQNLHTLIVPPRYLAAHRAAFPLFQNTGQGAAVGKTLDLEACRKDGKEISIQLSLSAIQLVGAWHAVGTLRDITERKQAEAKLLETNRELEAATAQAHAMAVLAENASIAKSEFLANMSHEIRTPMNGVIGMTGLLLDTQLDDDQRRYAEIVLSSAESLLGLLNDILDFSKIEAGKLEMETLDFDLRATLDGFAEMMALKTDEKGLEFLCGAAPDVPTFLVGDPGRLRQILVNLTGNAVKFTDTGEVAVRVSLEQETEADALIRFSVRDTGIGIPADKQDALFQKFTQVDASTTRKYGGTGLGLAISKQLVQAMGGEIGVNSPATPLRAGEEGRGSEFWFTVRLRKQPEHSKEDEQTLAAGLSPTGISGARILIVDDNANNREILRVLFTAWGARPDEAPDGQTSLRLLHQAVDAGDPYAVAVLDMQMPGMDGETLGRAIRADAALRDTRLVMMTSLGQRRDAARLEAIGFAAYLTKPVRQAELFDSLAAVLAGRAAHSGNQMLPRHTIRKLRRTNARILLAEDNITNQQVALGILKKLGLRGDAVANGAEAVTALEQIPYDLVLMDVQMPVMNGYEATTRIRDPQSAVRNHHVPVIAMTAHAMAGDREKCLEAGMNDYVSKPVAPKALADALEKWLPEETDGKRQEAEAGSGMRDVKDSSGPHPPSASLSHPSPLVFDRAGMLERLMGDEDLARTIAKGFLGDIPKQIRALQQVLESGDVVGVGRQAHTIQGAAANVGGEALREIAFEMEKAGKAGDLDAAKERGKDLVAAFDRLRQEMEQAF